jgi:hypothetical protein
MLCGRAVARKKYMILIQKKQHILISMFFCIILSRVISDEKENNMLIVAPPLIGVYISPNTPGSRVPSHGTSGFGEEYAIDFVMINANDQFKKPYRKSFFEYLFKGLQLSDFYGWGQKVYSPVNGEVVGIENNISERNPVNIFRDYKNAIDVTNAYIKKGVSSKTITGNYIMIKITDNEYKLSPLSRQFFRK